MSENFVEIIGRDGRCRHARKGEILADGERFSLPMRFMDAVLHDALIEKRAGPALVVDAAGAPAGHRPGFLMLDRDTALADSAAEAYGARSRRMSTAWQRRNDDQRDDRHADYQDPVPDRAASPRTLDQARAAADVAREARDERMRNAWRTR